MTDNHRQFMLRAIQLADKGITGGAGGPFGAVVVKDGKIIGEGYNNVISEKDPTAHAEVVAIREACKTLGDFQLHDCVIYTSCEPCPMCLGAIYWARMKKVFFACTREDAKNFGFDDQHIYAELDKPMDKRAIEFTNFMRDEALPLFPKWFESPDKKPY